MREGEKTEKELCEPLIDLVSRFVDYQVDKVYVYFFRENMATTYNFFYEKENQIYSSIEMISLLEYPRDSKIMELQRNMMAVHNYTCELEQIWDENIFNYCMEVRITYDVHTQSVDIFHFFDIPEDEDFYWYAPTSWLNELKIEHGQEPVEGRAPKKMFSELEKENIKKWRQVFSSCLGKMTAIQLACGEHVVGEQDWEVNFQKGVIQFGNDEYPIQFLGSESREDETWLWGWENVNQFDEKLLKLVKTAKQQGEALGLESFGVAEVALNNSINGHNLATVVCGLQEPPLCYYRCPHSGGAAFVALTEVPQEVFAPVNLQKFTDITMKCINYHKIDHKVFVESFLDWNKTAYHWDGNCIIAQFDQELQIGFEEIKSGWRIEKMEISSL